MQTPASGAMHDRDSLSWQLNSRWFVLIGGARAAIMQVADPKVAAGVAQFSNYQTDPIGRLERTMDSMLTIGFGTPEQREAVLEDLRGIHSAVRGRTSGGKAYSALDPQLMYWVLATLVDTVLVVERRYLGRMRHADRVRYVEESRVVADAFGIPEKFVPDGYGAFRSYMAERVQEFMPDDDSRQITRSLLKPGLPIVPDPVFAPLDWITIELLPSTLRHRLGLSNLNPVQLTAVRSAQTFSRLLLPVLPAQLSVNPFAVRALAKRPQAATA